MILKFDRAVDDGEWGQTRDPFARIRSQWKWAARRWDSVATVGQLKTKGNRQAYGCGVCSKTRLSAVVEREPGTADVRRIMMDRPSLVMQTESKLSVHHYSLLVGDRSGHKATFTDYCMVLEWSSVSARYG